MFIVYHVCGLPCLVFVCVRFKTSILQKYRPQFRPKKVTNQFIMQWMFSSVKKKLWLDSVYKDFLIHLELNIIYRFGLSKLRRIIIFFIKNKQTNNCLQFTKLPLQTLKQVLIKKSLLNIRPKHTYNHHY